MAHPQAWRCVSPSHWTREFSSMEAYFYFVGTSTSQAFGRETSVVCGILKVSGNLPAERLREAWKMMRFYHPGLATTVEDGSLHYRVPSEQDLEAWMHQTFIVASGTAEELFPSLQQISSPTLYWLPDSSELMTRCSHWRVDGLGGLLLWNNFFDLIGQSHSLPWGEEVANLASTEDVKWNRIPSANRTAASSLLETWAKNVPGVGPPSEMGKVPPGACRCKTIILSKEDTKEIASYRKVSPTSAIQAAWALANAKHQDKFNPSHVYATLGSFSLRSYLGYPSEHLSPAASLCYMALPIVIPVTNFEEMSIQLAKQYKEYHDKFRGEGRAELCETIDALYAASQVPTFFQGPVSRDALCSNIGIVERYLKTKYHDFEIINMTVAMDFTAGLTLLSVYTFRGQLRMSYSYNDAYQDSEDIQTLLNTTTSILLNQCRVSNEENSDRLRA